MLIPIVASNDMTLIKEVSRDSDHTVNKKKRILFSGKPIQFTIQC